MPSPGIIHEAVLNRAKRGVTGSAVARVSAALARPAMAASTKF